MVHENEILGVIGPAQLGKTSLLRCVNRAIEFTAGARVSGSVHVEADPMDHFAAAVGEPQVRDFDFFSAGRQRSRNQVKGR